MCVNPSLILNVDLSNTPQFVKRYERLGYTVKDFHAYKFVTADSRKHELEQITEYNNLTLMEVPCGNCIQCRLTYARDWAIRCDLESRQYQHNYFVTLTYDNEFLHLNEFGNNTLDPKDFTKFIKDLRQEFKRRYDFDGIRFFGCGEYGDGVGMRSHLHFILFNCPIPDLTLDFVDDDGNVTRHKNSLGDWYYYSPMIAKLWKKGFITIANCSYNTSAYVSRYVLKKQKGKSAEFYSKLGIEPPFLRMSRMPGIGFNYIKEHVAELVDLPVLVTARPYSEPMVSGLPRYFKKYIKAVKPIEFSKMIDKAKDDILKSRSLLKGKQKINDNRKLREENITSAFQTFQRDL